MDDPRDNVPEWKLQAILDGNLALLVASSPEAQDFWTDEEYQIRFGHPKPRSDADLAEIAWAEIMSNEEDRTFTSNWLVNQPGCLLLKDRFLAWVGEHPEIKQLRIDQTGYMVICTGKTYPRDYPGVVYTREDVP